MRDTNQTVAVGVFRDRNDAQKAIEELKRQGFAEEDIGVVARHDEDVPEGAERQGDGSKAGKGAGIGAATGLGVGGLWGLGIVAGALPGIGPAIAGGALAGVLSSAAAGAAAGGVIGALAGLGMSEDEAEYYEGEFQQGRIIVTVRSDRRYDEARTTMGRFGAYDIRSARGRPDAAERDRGAMRSTDRAPEGERTTGPMSGDVRTPPSLEQEGGAWSRERARERERDRRIDDR